MTDGFRTYRGIYAKVESDLQLKLLPKIKSNLRSSASNVTNLMDVLVRKSFLKEDLYRYDDKIIDSFELPEVKAYDEQRKEEEMYNRLKLLAGTLPFLADSMPLTIEELSDVYLQQLLKSIDYFAFHMLASGNNANTRAMKEIIDRAQGTNDEIFKRILSDNLKLLIDSCNTIKSGVEEIYRIQKQLYKIQIRYEVMPDIPTHQFTEELFKDNSQKYIDNFNLYVNSNCPGIPFIKHWAYEAISEYYSLEENEAVSQLSKELIGEDEEAQKIEVRALSPREKLINIIYDIAQSKNIIQDIYYDLDYNIKLTRSEELGFIANLVKTLRILLNIQDDKDFFHVEYINPTTKRTQKDIIRVADFMGSIKKRIQTFEEILKPNTDANYKIKNGTNESLLKFLDSTYFSLLLLKERIISINLEIRAHASGMLKSKLRDLTASAQSLEQHLNLVGMKRRRFVMDQEQFNKGKAKT